jgi:hypothetical protein
MENVDTVAVGVELRAYGIIDGVEDRAHSARGGACNGQKASVLIDHIYLLGKTLDRKREGVYVKGDDLAGSGSRRGSRRASCALGGLGSNAVNAGAIESAIQADINRRETKWVVRDLASVQKSTQVHIMHVIVTPVETLDIIAAAELFRRDAGGAQERSVLGGRRVRGSRRVSQKGTRKCGEARKGKG